MMAIHRAAAMRSPRQPRRTTAPVERYVHPCFATAKRVAGGDVRLLRVVDRVRIAVLDGRYNPPR